MKTETLQSIRRGKKRMTCVHEAAHVVVATAQGRTKVSSRIGQSADGRWLEADSVFQGQLSGEIAVAGAIGWLLQDDWNVTAEECVAQIEQEDKLGVRFLSRTDRSGYPNSRAEQVAACDGALDLLRDNNTLLQWAIEKLDTNLEISADELRGALGGDVDDGTPEQATNGTPSSAEGIAGCLLRIVDAATGEVLSQTAVNLELLQCSPKLGEWIRLEGRGDYTCTQRLFAYGKAGVALQLFVAPGLTTLAQTVNQIRQAAGKLRLNST